LLIFGMYEFCIATKANNKGVLMRHTILYMLTVTSALSIVPIMGWAADESSQDSANLLNLSLQQLSDIEVTSVSKKAEKASQAPAAIYVITQEDIRRSGFQSVPELLRMVPGLQVAQSGSQNWSITSRGFDGQFANKLLVLIDGRTVYSPIFSGVFWDIQNLMLEDIERIEVIRGPGATLWGANAVNGVINIISKNAKDTQGKLVTASVGNQERVSTGARYGGAQGDLSYRTYAQYFNNNQEQTVANPISGVSSGTGAQDQWHNAQGGFRLDWNGSEKEQKTLQGDVYQGVENSLRFLPVTSTVNPSLLNVVNDTDNVSGLNILGRFKHEINAGSDITLQAYYDDVIREFEYVGTSFHTQTFDLDFQHNINVNSYNDVTWGLGYRRIDSAFGNSFYIGFSPENFYENLYSSFIQDKITILQDRLFLTIGTKLEHNDFSGFEWEPSARLAWTPTASQTIWTAVSRAVRTPNQSDQNINLVLGAVPNSPTAIVTEQGQASATANVVTAYELGYRIQPKENLSFDLTGFVNEYKRLDSSANGTGSVLSDPIMGSYFNSPVLNTNDNSGETQGIEVATTWEATKYLKFSGGYTLFYSHLHSVGTNAVITGGNAPTQQFNLRSYVDLPYNMQWDTMLYYVDSLPTVSDGFGNSVTIPAYTRLDMRLGWQAMQGLDLSLIGQNLLKSEHQEASPFLYQTPEEIGRSVIAKATLRF
jgi:iron complex outermembrane receptor protein